MNIIIDPYILLITPPFSQLNTPYPATAYLTGFIDPEGAGTDQLDLGLEVFLSIFSKEGLKQLFAQKQVTETISKNSQRILSLKENYISTIDSVIHFLQGKNPAFSYRICERNFLPEASRFQQLDNLDWAFGTMGIQDKAKHLATLYLEDIGDYITECIDPHFGFSRYAERLGRSANTFDELYNALNTESNYIDQIMIDILRNKVHHYGYNIVGLSVAFPGNLYGALKCGKYIKTYYPEIKVVIGGGFVNTELRSLSDTRFFEYVDYVCLDDGENPFEQIIKLYHRRIKKDELCRTFVLENNKVVYYDNKNLPAIKSEEIEAPSYKGLPLDKYISVIEIANPMHRLWSDGRWNKLTLAHGCYWAKCSFCDTSLDYIKRYDPDTINSIIKKIKKVISDTNHNGFHFVDEAAPPKLLKELAQELIRRKINITWWTNIRFEKNFTADLCRLMAASGCIAVSGGLEVASKRILQLINKGVSIEQVAQVTDNFTSSRIMVHAYLMYGFPGQTEQETVDSLEVVRQLFEMGIVQSGFWHHFAMTVHSDVGRNPQKYHTKLLNTETGTFANNDLEFEDLKGGNHEKLADGLKKSLFNFMHGIGFDFHLNEWFDFKIPPTSIAPDLIENILERNLPQNPQSGNKVVWLGNQPQLEYFVKKKKGKQMEMAKLSFHQKASSFSISVRKEEGDWLNDILSKISVYRIERATFKQLEEDYNKTFPGLDFQLFWYSKSIDKLREEELLVL